MRAAFGGKVGTLHPSMHCLVKPVEITKTAGVSSFCSCGLFCWYPPRGSSSNENIQCLTYRGMVSSLALPWNAPVSF